jgi:hypothetical protein
MQNLMQNKQVFYQNILYAEQAAAGRGQGESNAPERPPAWTMCNGSYSASPVFVLASTFEIFDTRRAAVPSYSYPSLPLHSMLR